MTVTDTGRGMSADDLERIFMPFERLGAERSGIEGTGIGLPLAKALAEAMQGRLTATSVLDEGSKFTITLPRAPDLETAATDAVVHSRHRGHRAAAAPGGRRVPVPTCGCST